MLDVEGKQHEHNVIVAGFDFSDPSAAALKEAVSLASRSPSGELHVVHVFSMPSPPGQVGTMVVPEFVYFQQIDASASRLAAWLKPYRDSTGIRLAAHLRLGAPAREIAQVASDVGATLIVVGTHSHHGLERLFLGSVAESLVRRAPCAVLAYRPREQPAWELIEPPCPDCVDVQRDTRRAKLWCARHSEHHARAHTYHDYPDSYGLGAQTFRSEP